MGAEANRLVAVTRITPERVRSPILSGAPRIRDV